MRFNSKAYAKLYPRSISTTQKDTDDSIVVDIEKEGQVKNEDVPCGAEEESDNANCESD